MCANGPQCRAILVTEAERVGQAGGVGVLRVLDRAPGPGPRRVLSPARSDTCTCVSLAAIRYRRSRSPKLPVSAVRTTWPLRPYGVVAHALRIPYPSRVWPAGRIPRRRRELSCAPAADFTCREGRRFRRPSGNSLLRRVRKGHPSNACRGLPASCVGYHSHVRVQRTRNPNVRSIDGSTLATCASGQGLLSLSCRRAHKSGAAGGHH
jgi:hypothetical protein